MPRLSTRTILEAYQQDALLPLLLRECRTIDSARSELRWLRQHAIDLTQLRKEQRYQHLQHLQQARKSGQEHAPTTKQPHRKPTHHQPPENAPPKGWRRTLRTLCHARARGTPLQYLLGDQPFGDLTILCQKGVLIPRNDTETFTYAAAEQIRQHFPPPKPRPEPAFPSPPTRTLKVLDLCTGTGCITLLLHALLSPSYPSLKIVGIDIHPPALRLARTNLHHNVTLGDLSTRATEEVEFRRADVLASPAAAAATPNSHSVGQLPALEELLPRIPEFRTHHPQDTASHVLAREDEGASEGDGKGEVQVDVIISNPPYISRKAFLDGTTARSVRFHEPVLALVPPSSASSGMKSVEGVGQTQAEDVFYARILGLVGGVGARMVVFECGDHEQGGRVVELCRRAVELQKLGGSWEVGIWEDETVVEAGGDGEKEGACMVVMKQVQG
ncbi:S-adenosyl-L-methionine-dependent methyltransferase [Aspergillus japonicus CBS 114.51]|uniref:S-adenosyl-L-methionine-dependent methyltransferase n=2 Tax=Aspergillus TaxID=5052 RepID=A0A2V5HV83_ASPV1|nr:S-adenosyl-L-methionine-dependent methyltransferase [Aspergillus japonicus CBS 114.51]PYI15787.1 S-adenosyl-L-methionine-dependent methyltransferase [Aspergillus violaceofuscus CBS 115571]RAH86250.1 S-adenosyl-L-methionine-dependent methyltransferase [Aspergillus japonicus CBS 114.51]